VGGGVWGQGEIGGQRERQGHDMGGGMEAGRDRRPEREAGSRHGGEGGYGSSERVSGRITWGGQESRGRGQGQRCMGQGRKKVEKEGREGERQERGELEAELGSLVEMVKKRGYQWGGGGGVGGHGNGGHERGGGGLKQRHPF
jgi:hypothetical protein